MRLTPIDIRKQQFRKAMRGFDVDEVETFMTLIADEMEELIGTAQKNKAEIATLKERLGEYQQMEATMRETLVTVQKAAEEKRDAARKEAEIIIKEAEVQASNWMEDAHRTVREVKKELARLGGMRDSYVSRLKMLMQSQLDMLKMLEKDDEVPEETLNMFEERLASLQTGRSKSAAPEPTEPSEEFSFKDGPEEGNGSGGQVEKEEELAEQPKSGGLMDLEP